MADIERSITIGFLNVVATPPPPGIYERLLRLVANQPVVYWGENTAAITTIRKRRNEDDFFVGQILTWVEIDPRSPAVDKQRLEEVPLSDDVKRMTSSLGFNSKVFRFILDAKEHRITLESRNEFGQRLSPRRALSIFERLLSADRLGRDEPLVEVTVIPEDDALKYVLSLPRLDRVDILVKRPNEDDVTKETYDVLAELADQNAKRQEISLVRAPQTDGLELNEKNQTYARVAADGNGYVSARGRDADGEAETRSTKAYPKIMERVVEAGSTYISYLLDAAKEARARRPRR